jgi:hypothetical protein
VAQSDVDVARAGGGERDSSVRVSQLRAAVRFLATTLGLALLIATILFSAGAARYGSFNNCLAAMRGEALVVVPAVVDLGSVSEQTSKVATFQVRNLTGKSISILGASTSCGCVATGDFPVGLGPYETKELALQVSPGRPRDGSRFSDSVAYYTSASSAPFTVLIVADVSKTPMPNVPRGEPTPARSKEPNGHLINSSSSSTTSIRVSP